MTESAEREAPALVRWRGEVDALEYRLLTFEPDRDGDVALLVLSGEALALVRKPYFEVGIWRPPGGGVKAGETLVEAAEREALEEVGLEISVERHLVTGEATFTHDGATVSWRTDVLLARTDDRDLVVGDPREIAAARWGTLTELGGSLRGRLLEVGRELWKYRAELDRAALLRLGTDLP